MCETERPTFSTPEDHIVSQYRKVAGALNTMFLELRRRTVYEVWRSNGVGSCDIYTTDSEKDIEGIAKEKLLKLRFKKNPYAYTGDLPCGFHKNNEGCILGDLKSPHCLSHIENSWELEQKFGINGQELRELIRSALGRILQGGANPDEEDFTPKPETNDQYVAEATQHVQDLINGVKEFPILTKEDIRQQTKRFCNYFLNEAI